MNNTHEGHHMMMMMYFHTDFGGDYILFKGWKPDNQKDFTLACVIVFLFTILYEGLKLLREYLYSKQIQNDTPAYRDIILNGFHLLQTLLHGVQYTFSYCLMLIAMTYNVYLFFSIVVGSGVGYLVFNPAITKLRARYQEFGDPCCE